MDDKFLYQLRETPRPHFAEGLYRRLQNGEVRSSRRWKPAWAALLAFVIVAAGMMSVSPVRSAVMTYLKQIGGLPFEVTTSLPADDGPVTELESQRLPLEEALALSPFPIHLPSGVQWEAQAEVIELDAATLNFVFLLHGYTADGKWISLSLLTHPNTEHGEYIAPEAAEEVYLDAEHPAALIRGGWDADKKMWTYKYGSVRLKWHLDGVDYDLGGLNIDPETLLGIARSTLP